MRFLNALGFLTIIKIPQKYYLKKEQFPQALIYFPVIGLFIGIIISVFLYALSFVFPFILAVVLAVGLEVIITGGLHLDGAADMFDGVFSGESDKEKIMQIMKKPDIGVFGILIILFSIILKIGFIYFIVSSSSGLFSILMVFSIISFMPAFGRWSMLFLFSRYDTAMKEGSLANIFSGSGNKRIFNLSAIYLPLSFILINSFLSIFNFFSIKNIPDLYYNPVFNSLNKLLIIPQNGWFVIILIIIKYILMVLLIYIFLILIGKFFTRKIGGISGDILGGISVMTELFFLVLSYLFLRLV